MATEALPERIGPYQVVGLLGKGGMGSVYKAFKPPLRRYVAVKIIKKEFTATPGALDRFRREAELASDLKHPNIVTVFDYEEVPDGDSYIVTELIEGGETLRDRLMKGPLTLEETSDILRQIASALDYAYEKAHIVHRDIKPSNIFLESGKRIALGDFGIAKDITSDTNLTAINQGVGTPDYMSPEQAMGEPLDRRSDVYSLGIVLYEMLVGTVPFKGDTPISVVMSHIQKPVPSVRQANPHLSMAIQQVVEKALAKRKEDRYSTAGQFSEAFAAAIKPGAATAYDATAVASPLVQPGINQAGPTILNNNYPVATLLNEVTQLEAQNKFQAAFDRLDEGYRQFPYDLTLSTKHQKYKAMGYEYKSSQPASNYNPSTVPGPRTQQTPAGPYTPNPVYQQQRGGYPSTGVIEPARKSSPLPLIIGAGAVLVVAAVALLIVLVAGGGGNKNPTPTVQAVVSPTVAATTAAPSPSATSTTGFTPTPTKAATPTVPPSPTKAATPTISTGPKDQAKALAKQGDDLFDQKKYSEAVDKYQAAIKLDPSVAGYYEYLVRSYLNLDKYEEMEDPSRKMVQLEPGNAAYHYYLGISLYETFRAVEAEKSFREAVRLKPGEPLYHRYLANALLDQERYTDAEVEANKAIQLNPAEPENHNTLGRIFQDEGKYTDAEKEFRSALSQNSSSAIYQYNVALAVNSQSRWKEAETEARKAIALDSNYASPYSVLSIALRNQGRNEEALEAANKGAQLNPKSSVYPVAAANALINLKRYDEAETLARKATQLNSQSDLAFNALGDALYFQSKYQDALEAYSSAVNLFNRSYIYLTNQANAYAKLSEFAKARDAYNKALAIKSDYKPALDGLEAIKGK